MTTAFISALTANPYNHSYPSLLDHIRQSLKARGLKCQKPQLSSSQRFNMTRPFNLTDIIPNQNHVMGRVHQQTMFSNPNKQKKKKKKKHFGGHGFGLAAAVLGGVAGGMLLNEIFD